MIFPNVTSRSRLKVESCSSSAVSVGWSDDSPSLTFGEVAPIIEPVSAKFCSMSLIAFLISWRPVAPYIYVVIKCGAAHIVSGCE